MSSQEQMEQPVRRLRSLRRRKTGLDVDLNVVPPNESQIQVGGSAPRGVAEAPPAPIDLEAFDDDVIISSPRAFAEVCFSSWPYFLYFPLNLFFFLGRGADVGIAYLVVLIFYLLI